MKVNKEEFKAYMVFAIMFGVAASFYAHDFGKITWAFLTILGSNRMALVLRTKKWFSIDLILGVTLLFLSFVFYPLDFENQLFLLCINVLLQLFFLW